jgi:prepilin-type N-terminal cleavage/methylation domain-containing protein
MQPSVNQIRQQQIAHSEQGLTLLESLVAILVISLVAVAITPPIFIAVATRVQNRRAEQALQLAHGEIDKVRVLVDRGITEENQDQLPALASANEVSDVPPPSNIHNELQSTNFTCSEYEQSNNPVQIPVNTALPVDVNGDCEEDFFVQSFRVNEVDNINGTPMIFRMGVRVYSIAAENNIESGGLSEVQEASLILTTGQGQQDEYPLSAIYTDLGQGDRESSLNQYRCYLGENQSCLPERSEP